MITDDTIDISTAKFWCLFGDKKFQKLLQSKNQISEQDKVPQAGKSPIDSFMMWSGILFTAIGLSNLISPYIRNAFRKFTKNDNDVIAVVEFEADGKWYECSFNKKKMKWMLVSDSSITQEESLMFFKTKFFQAFCERCAMCIQPFFKNKELILKNSDSIKDQKVKSFILDLLERQREIQMNMFNPKYLT